MLFGIGIDIIEVSRIEKEISKEKKSFQKRIFTTKEIEYCESKRNNAQNYAVRFAAKEAFLKAIGTGMRNGITWKDIEIVNNELGKPNVIIHGKLKQIIEERKIYKIHVSLSHIRDVAIAVIILEL